MLFKSLLLLLTVVVPGIAGLNNYTSLIIKGEKTWVGNCGIMVLYAEIHLKIDQQNNQIYGCEEHIVAPLTPPNFLSICTKNCTGFEHEINMTTAGDIPVVYFQYNFCGSQSVNLWLNFALTIHEYKFYGHNGFLNMSIPNCTLSDQGIYEEGFYFCVEQTDNLNCDIQLSTGSPATVPTIPHNATSHTNSSTTIISTTHSVPSTTIPVTLHSTSTGSTITSEMITPSISPVTGTTSPAVTETTSLIESSTSSMATTTKPSTQTTTTLSTTIFSTLTSTPKTTIVSSPATSPSNNLTPNNPSSTPTTSPAPTPFIPPINPYGINCTDPDSELDKIFCHVESTNYTSGNISEIVHNTLNSVNVTQLTPKETFAVLGIFRRCSEVPDLSHVEFTAMSKLVDAMLDVPSESYVRTHEDGVPTTQTIVDSVARMVINSPSDSSYLDGSNVAIHAKSIDCSNGDAGGLSDSGSGFSADAQSNSQASISIDGNVACEGQGNRVFYTIYRNSKFFVGNENQKFLKNSFIANFADETTTTSEVTEQSSKHCNPSLFPTDGTILSGTVISNQSNSSSLIHIFANEEGVQQNIVTIKFKKKHIGVFLHGKLKVTWWDIAASKWSSESCTVDEEDGYYTSKCTHLTDFTLLVDGISTDPILCDKVLEIVNYVVSIGSMFSLLILNVIYFIILIPRLSQKIFSNIFLKIVPNSDKNIASFIYCSMLFLFFFTFTLFSNQDQVVFKTGCFAVAAINYWLLMSCIMLSLFQSWKIVKMFVWSSKMERVFHSITMKKVIYPITFSFSTLMSIGFGVITEGEFFRRNDSFCWIRPDYLIASVVVPLTFLSINAILTSFIMSLRLFPHFKISKLIRTSSTKINKISNKEARERAFVLFLVQFTLGVPWLLQYFTLFEPKATAWHFLFIIVNGSQGIIILISFFYRCYGTYNSYLIQKRLWT